MARGAEVPLLFGNMDYRTRKVRLSDPVDCSKYSADEVLEQLRDFVKKYNLEESGYNPGNASRLVFKDKDPSESGSGKASQKAEVGSTSKGLRHRVY